VPVYFLKVKKKNIPSEKMENIYDYILYIDKCRCEIQEQKEVPVWYTGLFRALDTGPHKDTDL
jgi:hypothetical protein